MYYHGPYYTQYYPYYSPPSSVGSSPNSTPPPSLQQHSRSQSHGLKRNFSSNRQKMISEENKKISMGQALSLAAPQIKRKVEVLEKFGFTQVWSQIHKALYPGLCHYGISVAFTDIFGGAASHIIRETIYNDLDINVFCNRFDPQILCELLHESFPEEREISLITTEKGSWVFFSFSGIDFKFLGSVFASNLSPSDGIHVSIDDDVAYFLDQGIPLSEEQRKVVVSDIEERRYRIVRPGGGRELSFRLNLKITQGWRIIGNNRSDPILNAYETFYQDFVSRGLGDGEKRSRRSYKGRLTRFTNRFFKNLKNHFQEALVGKGIAYLNFLNFLSHYRDEKLSGEEQLKRKKEMLHFFVEACRLPPRYSSSLPGNFLVDLNQLVFDREAGIEPDFVQHLLTFFQGAFLWEMLRGNRKISAYQFPFDGKDSYRNRLSFTLGDKQFFLEVDHPPLELMLHFLKSSEWLQSDERDFQAIQKMLSSEPLSFSLPRSPQEVAEHLLERYEQSPLALSPFRSRGIYSREGVVDSFKEAFQNSIDEERLRKKIFFLDLQKKIESSFRQERPFRAAFLTSLLPFFDLQQDSVDEKCYNEVENSLSELVSRGESFDPSFKELVFSLLAEIFKRRDPSSAVAEDFFFQLYFILPLPFLKGSAQAYWEQLMRKRGARSKPLEEQLSLFFSWISSGLSAFDIKFVTEKISSKEAAVAKLLSNNSGAIENFSGQWKEKLKGELMLSVESLLKSRTSSLLSLAQTLAEGFPLLNERERYLLYQRILKVSRKKVVGKRIQNFSRELSCFAIVDDRKVLQENLEMVSGCFSEISESRYSRLRNSLLQRPVARILNHIFFVEPEVCQIYLTSQKITTFLVDLELTGVCPTTLDRVLTVFESKQRREHLALLKESSFDRLLIDFDHWLNRGVVVNEERVNSLFKVLEAVDSGRRGIVALIKQTKESFLAEDGAKATFYLLRYIQINYPLIAYEKFLCYQNILQPSDRFRLARNFIGEWQDSKSERERREALKFFREFQEPFFSSRPFHDILHLMTPFMLAALEREEEEGDEKIIFELLARIKLALQPVGALFSSYPLSEQTSIRANLGQLLDPENLVKAPILLDPYMELYRQVRRKNIFSEQNFRSLCEGLMDRIASAALPFGKEEAEAEIILELLGESLRFEELPLSAFSLYQKLLNDRGVPCATLQGLYREFAMRSSRTSLLKEIGLALADRAIREDDPLALPFLDALEKEYFSDGWPTETLEELTYSFLRSSSMPVFLWGVNHLSEIKDEKVRARVCFSYSADCYRRRLPGLARRIFDINEGTDSAAALFFLKTIVSSPDDSDFARLEKISDSFGNYRRKDQQSLASPLFSLICSFCKEGSENREVYLKRSIALIEEIESKKPGVLLSESILRNRSQRIERIQFLMNSGVERYSNFAIQLLIQLPANREVFNLLDSFIKEAMSCDINRVDRERYLFLEKVISVAIERVSSRNYERLYGQLLELLNHFLSEDVPSYAGISEKGRRERLDFSKAILEQLLQRQRRKAPRLKRGQKQSSEQERQEKELYSFTERVFVGNSFPLSAQQFLSFFTFTQNNLSRRYVMRLCMRYLPSVRFVNRKEIGELNNIFIDMNGRRDHQDDFRYVSSYFLFVQSAAQMRDSNPRKPDFFPLLLLESVCSIYEKHRRTFTEEQKKFCLEIQASVRDALEEKYSHYWKAQIVRFDALRKRRLSPLELDGVKKEIDAIAENLKFTSFGNKILILRFLRDLFFAEPPIIPDFPRYYQNLMNKAQRAKVFCTEGLSSEMTDLVEIMRHQLEIGLLARIDSDTKYSLTAIEENKIMSQALSCKADSGADLSSICNHAYYLSSLSMAREFYATNPTCVDFRARLMIASQMRFFQEVSRGREKIKGEREAFRIASISNYTIFLNKMLATYSLFFAAGSYFRDLDDIENFTPLDFHSGITDHTRSFLPSGHLDYDLCRDVFNAIHERRSLEESSEYLSLLDRKLPILKELISLIYLGCQEFPGFMMPTVRLAVTVYYLHEPDRPEKERVLKSLTTLSDLRALDLEELPSTLRSLLATYREALTKVASAQIREIES